MTDHVLKSLVTRASDAAAGIPPSIDRIRAGRSRRRARFPIGVVATAVSGVAAIFILVSVATNEVEPPESAIDPDMYVLSDQRERSDWLVQSASAQVNIVSRSDWLLAGSSPSREAFASDHFAPNSARVSEAYLLVDSSGKPVSDPNQPNVIYVIERTTP